MEKNEQKQIWFARKTYGWGWTPVTWQGWAAVALYVLIVAAAALSVGPESSPAEFAFTFFLPIVLSTIALIRIGYKKGESPRWQWGKSNNGSHSK
ncbi:MAG TPA: hypothetical protein VGE62_00895 [Candidatus Paceibacterota bacterium]